MMAAQPYPTQLDMSSQRSRNMYRQPPGQPTPTYAYQQPPPNMYMGHHEMTNYGLVTPPTTTPAQFGSPLIASGGYPPMHGTPSTPWGFNALALSPDPLSAGGYYSRSPMLPADTTCAAPTDVFSVPLPTPHSEGGMFPGDGLGFPGMVPHHPGMHRRDMIDPSLGQLGMKPSGHIMLGADGQPTPEIKKRSRTAQACERCRIRKARCFGGNPCNRCTKRRFVCEFSTQVRQRGPNKLATPASAATGGSKASGTSPKSAPRRHSLPESQQAALVVPPPPTKTYSTSDVATLASPSTSTPDAAPMTSGPPSATAMSFSVPGTTPTTMVPNLPTPQSSTDAYLSVPASQGYATDHRSPVFAFTPDISDGTSTATSSLDYPYTPISPGQATFSPPLAMTPTTTMGVYTQQPMTTTPTPAPTSTLPDDSNTWYQTV